MLSASVPPLKLNAQPSARVNVDKAIASFRVKEVRTVSEDIKSDSEIRYNIYTLNLPLR